MKVLIKGKEIEIEDIISCPIDSGVMVFDKNKQAFVCVNVEGCDNEISLKEYLLRRNFMPHSNRREGKEPKSDSKEREI